MVKTPFRFLHAADMHLEHPIEGIGEGAQSIEERLLSAPMNAAQRLFQAAQAEQVDFVLLSGNIVDPNCSGPGPLVFLVQQFQKLAEFGIPVYWAGSEHDGPEDWPVAIHLPENVHFFRTGNVEETIVNKGGIPVVRLLGLSRGNRRRLLAAGEFTPDASGLYTIVVANGQINPDAVRFRNIPFWALGGLSRRTYNFHPEPSAKNILQEKSKSRRYESQLDDYGGKTENLPIVVHYPGSTLARSSKDCREFGGTLVDVDVKGFSNLTFLPSSPFRWVEERVELDSGATMKQLRTEMQKRIHAYRSIKSRDDLMISWVVDSPLGSLATDLRTGAITEQLLDELRTDYGLEPPICWSVSISTTLPENVSPGLYDQKTILSDFLRGIRYFQQHPYEPINLLQFLPRDYRELPFGNQLSLSLPAELVSESLLKTLLFEDAKKELTPMEKIQLENIRKKIREDQRLQRQKIRMSKGTYAVGDSTEPQNAFGGEEEPRKRSVRSRHYHRQKREKILKQMRIRQRIVRDVLLEAAALGWDLLGSEIDKKAMGLVKKT